MATRTCKPKRRLTTALWMLAFLALANLVVCIVRLAADSSSRGPWGRIAIDLAVGTIATWLALRGRVHVRAEPLTLEPPDRPPSLPLEPRVPRPVWQRCLRYGVSLALIVVAAVSVAGQWGTVEAAIGELRHLDWRWVRWGVYAEALSIIAYAWIQRTLLRAGGRQIAMAPLIALSLAGNALATSMPGGPPWAASFSFGQLRRRGAERRLAAFVLLFTLLASLAALVVLLVAGIDLAGSTGPAASFRPFATAAAIAGALLSAVLLIRPTRRWTKRCAGRWLGHLGPLRNLGRRATAPVRRQLAEPGEVRCSHRILAGSFVAALLNWLTDCACLVAAILAVSGHVPWRGLLVIYALTQVAENLPITPGGIGVVEGALSLLLVAYGMPADTAVAAVLLYRIISFWVLVPIGWLAAGGLMLRDRRPPRVALGQRRMPAPAVRPSRA